MSEKKLVNLSLCKSNITSSHCSFIQLPAVMATGKVDMKIVLLGKEHVGKTCLAQRYLHEKFGDSGNYQAVSFLAYRQIDCRLTWTGKLRYMVKFGLHHTNWNGPSIV